MFRFSLFLVPNKFLMGLSVSLAVVCAIVFSTAERAEGGYRGRLCPDYSPQPTHIPKPNTILIPSPNFGVRDNAIPGIDTAVIHTTEVSLGGTLRIFQDRASSVSAHFVVAPNGDIYEMVDTEDRAWHATYYNSRSIGIEMVGFAGQRSTWNENNLASLVDLLSWIVTAYPDIPLTHPEGNAYNFPSNRFDTGGLVAHGQVQPWNRTDPGRFFPWDDVIDDVAARIVATPEPNSALLFLLGAIGLLSARRHRTYLD